MKQIKYLKIVRYLIYFKNIVHPSDNYPVTYQDEGIVGLHYC